VEEEDRRAEEERIPRRKTVDQRVEEENQNAAKGLKAEEK
jgi:hypothetical protein